MDEKILNTMLSDKALKTLEQHEKEKGVIHTFVESDAPRLNGIACPKCGKELFDTSPNVTLYSNPAKTHIHCAGCGFKSLRTV